MRPDLRRRGVVPALSLLTACGVAVLTGCSSQPASPSNFKSGDGASQAGNTAVAVTVECPKVADALPDVRVSQAVRRTVARNLGVLEIQVADANRRLAQTPGAQDAAAAQQAVLTTLANQRAVTIERISTALDGVAQRPRNLADLATCTLGNGGGVVNPTAAPAPAETAPSSLPPSAPPTAAPTVAPTVAPSGDASASAPPSGSDGSSTGGLDASPVPSALPTDGAVEVTAANASAAPLGSTAPTDAPTSAAPTATPGGTANPTATANPTGTAAPTGTPAPVPQRLLFCPPVADQIVIPRSVKSDVALELGLMELQASNANERLTGAAGNTGTVDQEAVLRRLAEQRTGNLSRIATLLDRSGGQVLQDLGTLVSCRLTGDDALIDNNGSTGAVAPTAAPTDAPAVSPAPTGTTAPGNGDAAGAGTGDGTGTGAGGSGAAGGGSGDDVWFADANAGY